MSTICKAESRKIHTAETEGIVLLENPHDTFFHYASPSSSGLHYPYVTYKITSHFPRIALSFKFGDYVSFNASSEQYEFNQKSILAVRLWSNDGSGFADAVQAAQSSDVAIVMVR